MALSGSFSGSICGGHYSVKVNWSATQNASSNTSTITATMYFIHDWSLYDTCRSNTLTIDGTTTEFGTKSYNGETGNYTVGTATKTVTHNSNGDRSVTISATANIQATISGTYYSSVTATSTINLDNIPRCSTISAVSPRTIGNTFTFTIDRKVSSYTHDLFIRFGGDNWGNRVNSSRFATSTTWTASMNRCLYFPNSPSGSMYTLLRTYDSSGNIIGDSTDYWTVEVPSSIKPTATLSVSEATSGIAEQFGCYVKSKSSLNISVTGAGSYGSTIQSYYIGIGGGGVSAASYTTGPLYEDTIIKADVTDTRGRVSDQKSQNITVVDYSDPTCAINSVVRCNASGTEQDYGTCLKISYSYGISPVNNKNKHSVMIQYLNGTSWTTLTTLTAYSSSGTYITSAIFSVDSSYKIRLIVADYFTTVGSYKDIGPSFTLMNFSSTGKGMSIGKICEYDGNLDMGMPIKHCGLWTHAGQGTLGSSGAVKLARITITGPNIHAPIEFSLSRRSDRCIMHVNVLFTNTSTNDPSIASFTIDAPYQVYLYKAGTSIWDLYIQKTEKWDQITIFDVKIAKYMRARVIIKYLDEQASSIPTGYVAATDTSIKYIDKTFTSLAINTGTSAGYERTLTKSDLGIKDGNIIYSVTPINWSQMPGFFTCGLDSSGSIAYILSLNSGTIGSITLRVVYV